jgi:hypothetical protein
LQAVLRSGYDRTSFNIVKWVVKTRIEMRLKRQAPEVAYLALLFSLAALLTCGEARGAQGDNARVAGSFGAGLAPSDALVAGSSAKG